MRTSLIIIAFVPFLCTAQLKSKYIPTNTVALNDSLYIGQTEITNVMYREFVDFVRDSLFTVMLYDSLPFDRAKRLLQVPENRLKNFVVENRSEYAKIYGFNYQYYKSHYDSLMIDKTKSLYYPQAVRFYQRREIDVRKLIYKMDSSTFILVYPDTLSSINDYYVKYDLDSASKERFYVNPMVNMYFWHPAYDNYPVVGLNYDQILAYCHWYARQLNKNAKNPEIEYSVSIPTMENYTQAMKLCVPAVVESKIGPENLINPIIYSREAEDIWPHFHPAYQNVNPSIGLKTPSDFVMQEWVKTNATSPILNLLGGPSEIVQNPREPEYTTVLGGDYYLGIVDPSGIQANTLFYQRLLYKNQGYSFVSFRICVHVTHK